MTVTFLLHELHKMKAKEWGLPFPSVCFIWTNINRIWYWKFF